MLEHPSQQQQPLLLIHTFPLGAFLIVLITFNKMLSRAATLLARTTSRTTALRAATPAATTTATATPIVEQFRTMSTTTTSTTSNSGGQQLTTMVAANPHIDVVRYEHKNRVWTLNHVDYYATALAIGLTEQGLQPGDVVLSWLPSHFSEQVRL